MVPVRVLRPLPGRDPYSGPSPCLQRGGCPDPFRRRFSAGGLPGRRHLERPPGLDARVLLRRRVHLLRGPRSEEHTSELQSLRHLVCRLLLEKKKKKEI